MIVNPRKQNHKNSLKRLWIHRYKTHLNLFDCNNVHCWHSILSYMIFSWTQCYFIDVIKRFLNDLRLLTKSIDNEKVYEAAVFFFLCFFFLSNWRALYERHPRWIVFAATFLRMTIRASLRSASWKHHKKFHTISFFSC